MQDIYLFHPSGQGRTQMSPSLSLHLDQGQYIHKCQPKPKTTHSSSRAPHELPPREQQEL